MIVVTASAGDIGGQVVDLLQQAGAPLRLIARDPAKLSQDVRNKAETIAGLHGDADVVDRAFQGADTVFWLVPPDPKAPSVEAAYVDFTRPAAEA